MSTQYRLVQSGKTASGGCSAGPRFVRAVAPRIYFFYLFIAAFTAGARKLGRTSEKKLRAKKKKKSWKVLL
jgi:hypothetical protein